MAKAMPTLAQFKRLSRDVQPAAEAVLMARVFAKVERERVDAYVYPIFASYGFVYGTRLAKEERGRPMTSMSHLYLVDDEKRVAEFFEACDQAHRAHGFRGPKGHCPALSAENLVIVAERALIAMTAPTFGIDESILWGDDRARFLELVIGAAIKAA